MPLARDLLKENNVGCVLLDERIDGRSIKVDFVGTLRPDQASAVAELLAVQRQFRKREVNSTSTGRACLKRWRRWSSTSLRR